MQAGDGDPGARGKAQSGRTLEEEGSKGPKSREVAPEAWIIRTLPRTQDILKVYPAWLK